MWEFNKVRILKGGIKLVQIGQGGVHPGKFAGVGIFYSRSLQCFEMKCFDLGATKGFSCKIFFLKQKVCYKAHQKTIMLRQYLEDSYKEI